MPRIAIVKHDDDVHAWMRIYIRTCTHLRVPVIDICTTVCKDRSRPAGL